MAKRALSRKTPFFVLPTIAAAAFAACLGDAEDRPDAAAGSGGSGASSGRGGTGGVGDIGLALGEGGRVYASWPGASASGGVAVRFGVFDAGTWQAEDAYNVGETPLFAPASDLALDAAGDPHLCVAGVDTVLRYVARKGGVWSSEIVQSPAQQFRCRIGVDAQGGPHIVFSNVGGSPGNPPGQTGQFAIRHAVRSPSPGVDRDCDGAD